MMEPRYLSRYKDHSGNGHPRYRVVVPTGYIQFSLPPIDQTGYGAYHTFHSKGNEDVKADESPHIKAKVKNKWRYNSIDQYGLMEHTRKTTFRFLPNPMYVTQKRV